MASPAREWEALDAVTVIAITSGERNGLKKLIDGDRSKIEPRYISRKEISMLIDCILEAVGNVPLIRLTRI
jgi:hypothetical protein